MLASSNMSEHEEHLTLLLQRLENYGLRLNLSKSRFSVYEIDFLGYFLIPPNGTNPLPEKGEIIKNYKLPDTVKQLCTFLDMLNYYRHYLKHAGHNQTILNTYLKGTVPRRMTAGKSSDHKR